MSAFAVPRRESSGLRDLVLGGMLLFLLLDNGLPALKALAQDGGDSAPRVLLTNAFTYQGRLVQDGIPGDGAYDFQFAVYDNPTVGTGAPLGTGVFTVNDLQVANGLFTAQLDFGPNVFSGDKRWLEVRVRPGSSTGAYTTLGRNELTATSYALFATTAPWSGISGIPADIQDGDADTTYTAAPPLALNGTTFGLGTSGCDTGDTWVYNGAGWDCETASGAHNHFGQSWTGDAQLGFGVANTRVDGIAIQGDAGADGTGLIGTGETGVRGIASTGTAGSGVEGRGSFIGPGVFGATFTLASAGVLGRHDGIGCGLAGQPLSAQNCSGVEGEGYIGVRGKAGRADGVGVVGVGSTAGTGVAGYSTRSGFAGTYGENPNGTGVSGIGDTGVAGLGETGVSGDANVLNGAGVIGDGHNFGTGVIGRSTRANFAGTFGDNPNGAGVSGTGRDGVVGTTTLENGTGVIGEGGGLGTGVAGRSSRNGFAAVHGQNNFGTGVTGVGEIGIHGIAHEAADLAGRFDGDVQVNGVLTRSGGTLVTSNVRPDTVGGRILGTASFPWADVFAQDFSVVSDMRRKTNVAASDFGLDEVLQLRPVTFQYTAGESRTRIGLVAQDVQQVLPGVVQQGDDEDGTLTVSYTDLIPVLIRAIQEQQAEIDALKAGGPTATAGTGSNSSPDGLALALGLPMLAAAGVGVLRRRTV